MILLVGCWDKLVRPTLLLSVVNKLRPRVVSGKFEGGDRLSLFRERIIFPTSNTTHRLFSLI